MPRFGEGSMAWSLTRGLARVREVDLVAAVTDGWLSRQELARLVDRCAACGLSDHCTGWLAVTHQAEALPDYCRNKAEIEALAG